MPTFKRFEDIEAWKKARLVTKNVYLLTTKGLFAKDYGLADQIRRACVSIMANIAEGFGRRSNKEFGHFLNIAHASAAEAQSHLYVALDLEYINEDEFSQAYDLLTETSKMTVTLANYLRENLPTKT